MPFEDTFRAIAFFAARFTTFSANAFIFGLVPLLLYVLRPAFATLDDASWAEGRLRLSRRLEDLVQAALAASAVATVVALCLQGTLIAQGLGGQMDGETLSAILSTAFGRWTLLRLPLLLGLAVLLVRHVVHSSLAGAGNEGKAPSTLWWVAWGAMGAGLLLTSSMSGHAFVATPRVISIPNDVIHLASGATWLTGIVLIAIVLPYAWRGKDDAERLKLLAPVVVRFSRVAAISIGIVAVTGTINSFLDVGRLSDFVETRYGFSLTMKIIAFLFVLVLGGVNHFYVRRKLETKDQPRAMARLLRRTIAIELILAVAIIGLTAVLTGQARTREATEGSAMGGTRAVSSVPRT